MSAFPLEHRLGIHGTEGWIVSADHFTDLLDLVYRHHSGEIWLFNNDLRLFEDFELFGQIYLDKIGSKLGAQIRSVKILLGASAAKLVFPQPRDWMRDRLNLWCKQKRRLQRRMPELLFGTVSEAFRLKEINKVLNEHNVPSTHAWAFYVHGASLSRSRQNGLALLRPTQFPFSDHDEPLALSWHLSEENILSAKHKAAFTKSFLYSPLFWRLDMKSRLRKASAQCVESTAKSSLPEGIAFGERADVLVLAPANDELRCLRNRLEPGIRPIPTPAQSKTQRQNGEPQYECWTKSGERHVVLATLGEGNLAAAAQTARLLERFQPQHVILTGVAGATQEGREKFEIGDVVIGQSTIWYEWGIVSEQTGGQAWTFTPKTDIATDWGGEGANRVLYAKASKLLGKSLKTKSMRGKARKRLPRVALAIIGSGSKIVESNSFIQGVVYQKERKINAFETEAAGVCLACSSFSQHPVDCLVVRGVMDFANAKSRHKRVRKQNRDYALASCAEFVAMLLDTL